MRYVVTGGAGFIGSHLAEALAARGDQVVIADDFSTGRRQNIAHLVGTGAAELRQGSVTDQRLVDELVSSCDVCLHLASAVGVQLVLARPLETLQQSVQASDAVISAAARHGKRLLFASTSEVYGKASGTLHEESDRVLGSALKSRWSYAIAKSYGEALAYGYHREEGAKNVVVRLFNTIGCRQSDAYGMVVPRLVRQALTGQDVTVYGDGTQSRCFLHVADAVDAILTLSGRDDAAGRAFNIGNPVSITIIGLARRIVARARSSSRIVFVPYEDAYGEGFEEISNRRPDNSALSTLTGWTPQRTLDNALDDVIAYERMELAIKAPAGIGPTGVAAAVLR